ncbi:division/cell wall cluster transcriptional repressor MraZ [candidate division KSB1 bacterium]|nr:division/cell wall cluster transcriptional repressor MraZ [candidate division KSB1 bacterium]
MMEFFIGEYDYALDNKGRLNIPAKFRKAISPNANDTVIITVSQEKCLDVYPLDIWQDRIVSKLSDFSEMDKNQRRLTSLIGANSVDSVFDKQGRIMIPQKLLNYAELTNKVIIIGAFNRIELWNPDIREKYLQDNNLAIDGIDKNLLP